MADPGTAMNFGTLPLLSVMGDSGAAESTIQDEGWNGGQPAWRLPVLSISANAPSPPA
jgi:hypothetical protein